jgi:Tfp pilus assembly protein PilO
VQVKIKSRQQLLTILAMSVVAVFAADKLILTPLTHFWSARSKNLALLRKQVTEGQQLLNREQTLRSRWEQIRTNSLPDNASLAEQQLLNGLDRWAQDSRITITSMGQQWKHDTEDYMTLQCRVEANGSMERVSRFLYEIEKDPMALKIEALELSSRDNEGQQLSLGLMLNGLVLTPRQQKP